MGPKLTVFLIKKDEQVFLTSFSMLSSFSMTVFSNIDPGHRFEMDIYCISGYISSSAIKRLMKSSSIVRYKVKLTD